MDDVVSNWLTLDLSDPAWIAKTWAAFPAPDSNRHAQKPRGGGENRLDLKSRLCGPGRATSRDHLVRPTADRGPVALVEPVEPACSWLVERLNGCWLCRGHPRPEAGVLDAPLCVGLLGPPEGRELEQDGEKTHSWT